MTCKTLRIKNVIYKYHSKNVSHYYHKHNHDYLRMMKLLGAQFLKPKFKFYSAIYLLVGPGKLCNFSKLWFFLIKNRNIRLTLKKELD